MRIKKIVLVNFITSLWLDTLGRGESEGEITIMRAKITNQSVGYLTYAYKGRLG